MESVPAGRRWASPLAGGDAGLSPGPPAAQQGRGVSGRSATVEEIVAVLRAVGDRPDAHRLRALIVLLWRAGLRISEALALQARDLDRGRGAVLVRRASNCRSAHCSA